MQKLKPKKCKVCSDSFEPRSSWQKTCNNIQCAIKLTVDSRHNKEKKELAVRKEAIKTRSEHLKDTQNVFNAYIRARDHHLPCISCGRFHGGQYHAGHYLAVGSHPEIRFDELNVNKQCSVCNNYLSGNQIEYRRGLIEKIGHDNVDLLESKHESKKYTIEEILEIKSIYRLKLKEIKNMM